MLELVPFRREDRESILEWRNSPSVATFMYRDTPIGPEEHKSWFEKAMVDHPDQIHRLLLIDGYPSGVMSLSHIDRSLRSAEWGGYLAPRVPRGVGHGRAFIEACLNLAQVDLRLHLVYVEVLESNTAARRLYESIGFELADRIKDRVVRDDEPIAALRLKLALDG